MENKEYNRIADALDAANDLGDRDLQKQIIAQTIAKHGNDEDVDTLLKFHDRQIEKR